MALKNKKVLKWCICFLITIDFIHALIYYKQSLFSKSVLLYLAVHIPFILWLSLEIYRDLCSKDGIIYANFIKIKESKMPKNAIVAVTIVFMGNLISVSIGKPCYPFYDVGMFRWSTSFKDEPSIVHKHKYYFYKNNQLHVLDLRREGFLFFRKYLDITYSHIFTFSANYHNKSRKETFDYLSKIMKKEGVDTLWVGVQSVNYKSKKVTFDTDICNAIKTNNKEIHAKIFFIKLLVIFFVKK